MSETPARVPTVSHVVIQQAGPPKGKSVASMVLGFISIAFGFTLVIPVIGFVLGVIGYRREHAARGQAVTGIILSCLCLVGWVIGVAAIIGTLSAVAASVSY